MRSEPFSRSQNSSFPNSTCPTSRWPWWMRPFRFRFVASLYCSHLLDGAQRRVSLLRTWLIPGGKCCFPSHCARWVSPSSCDWRRAAGLSFASTSPQGASRCQPSTQVPAVIRLCLRQRLIDDWFGKPSLRKYTRYTRVSVISLTGNLARPSLFPISSLPRSHTNKNFLNCGFSLKKKKNAVEFFCLLAFFFSIWIMSWWHELLKSQYT